MVDNLVATSSQITVTIRNAGSTAYNNFWVDVYFNPNQTPTINQPWDTIAPSGAAWGVTKSLGQDESLVLTVGDGYYHADKSSSSFPAGASVYAYVDAINYDTNYGNVQESNEGNNLYGPVVSTAGVAGVVAPSTTPVSTEGLPER